MRVLVAALLAPVLAALTLAAASPALAVRTGPCVLGKPKGPKCLMWRAKVKWAADGDTVKPRIWQHGRWSAKRPVRMTGIQAAELRDYGRSSRRGECTSVKAARVLDGLVHHRRMRLVSQHRSVGGGTRGRLRRSLQVRVGGRWIDPAMVLLAQGLAIWSSDGREWAWNGTYSRLAQQAAAGGVGIWNPLACGHPGPGAGIPLKMRLRWNAPRRETPNGERIRIKNLDPARELRLRGWRLRDDARSLRHGYRFPRGAVIPPGRAITVRVGRGRTRSRVFHWGLTSSDLPEREPGEEEDRRRRLPLRPPRRDARVQAVPLPRVLPIGGPLRSGRRVSNPRPSAWEADALPTELRPR